MTTRTTADADPGGAALIDFPGTPRVSKVVDVGRGYAHGRAASNPSALPPMVAAIPAAVEEARHD